MVLDFSNCRILVIGDIMIDKYYFGKVERISPEAPVPIVNIVREESRLGGAANVANNINSLGGHAVLCGAIGYDFFGKEVERMANKKGIHTEIVKTEQPTITKARIIGSSQQIVRIDYEQKVKLSEQVRKNYLSKLANLITEYNIIIISDYGKGFIDEEMCSFIIEKAKENGSKIIVDPKGKDWRKYKGANIITPNVKELGEVIGDHINNDDSEIEAAAIKVIDTYNLSSLLVTRSDKGMSLFSKDKVFHIPTHSHEVFDVSGAGDTVVATLSLALCSGKSITDAIYIANIAAGIVIKKIGTATISIEELNNPNLTN